MTSIHYIITTAEKKEQDSSKTLYSEPTGKRFFNRLPVKANLPAA
jgi:hypothetical protein